MDRALKKIPASARAPLNSHQWAFPIVLWHLFYVERCPILWAYRNIRLWRAGEEIRLNSMEVVEATEQSRATKAPTPKGSSKQQQTPWMRRNRPWYRNKNWKGFCCQTRSQRESCLALWFRESQTVNLKSVEEESWNRNPRTVERV